MRRKKGGRVRIHTAWFKVWPMRGQNYAFWFSVAQTAKARGVRANNLPMIRQICMEIDR